MTRFGGHTDDLDTVGRPLAWFLASLAVVALALYVIGIEDVLETLARADRRDVTSVLTMAAATVLARGIALRIVFEIMNTSVSTLRAIALYLASTFLNDATPSGQVGGAPASGLLIAYTDDARYEIGFAAVLVINFLANLVMFAFGLAGVYLAATADTGTGMAEPDYGILAATTVGLILLIASAIVTLWRYRSIVADGLVEGLLRASRASARYVPRFNVLDRSAIAERIERFWNSLDRLGMATPREVIALFALLAVAHVASIDALWVAFRAVGEPLGFALVPTAVVAAIVPIPGGAGGNGVALIALLVATTSLEAATIGAAVVLWRAVTHWLRTLVGGVVAARLVAFGSTES